MRMILILLVLFLGRAVAAEPTWEQVHAEVNQEKPQSALKLVAQLSERARAAQDAPGMVKAAAYTALLTGQVAEGGRPEGAIPLLAAALPQLPPAAKPFGEMLLAQWYWSYFQNNRWRFRQRTATATSGDDFTAWDLRRLFTEIDHRFAAALAAPELKTTPIATFAGLMRYEPEHDARRPTLYDFVAHQALDFYQAGEQGLPLSEDAFALDAESPVFGPAAEFLAWKPQTTDGDARLLSAVRLYQALLAFHRADADQTAFLDADLARLRFGINQATGSTRAARYQAALERFATTHAAHPAMADALAALAETLITADPPRAHALAARGREAFRNSAGGIACHNLIARITAPALSVATDALWNAPWPTLTVTHRNLPSVSFRAIACDYEQLLTGRLGAMSKLAREHWIHEEELKKSLVALAPTRAWTTALPATPDYRERTTELPVPDDLPPGMYLILASGRADFPLADNAISSAFCMVGDVMLISRTGDSVLDGLVVEARSGAPIAGAQVRRWTMRWGGREPEVRVADTATTDADGRFVFAPGKDREQVQVSVRRGAVEYGPLREWQPLGRRESPERADDHTLLFTDRAIYRPGQTVHVKAICYRMDRERDNYQALAGRRMQLSLYDGNGRELAQVEGVSNDFGSFSTTFTAPAGAGTGQMRIASNIHGNVFFRVEEYKRPRFQVRLDSPAAEAVLGQEVSIVGTATAYTGAAIGGATVAWRVERTPRFPDWCWWGWHLIDQHGAQQVAHGRTVTTEDGRFTIAFPALGDAAVPDSTQAAFTFNVVADLTDSTGETRSASRQVTAGHVGAQAAIVAADWQQAGTPVALTLRTTTLDGVALARGGTLTVHALTQPAQVVRPRSQPSYDWWWRQRVLAQGRPDADPANPAQWPNGAPVAERAVTTDAQGAAAVPLDLPAGIFRAVFSTTDARGRAVRAERIVRVVDPLAAVPSVKEAEQLTARAWSVEPGVEFLALWGTGYDQGRAYVEIEHRGRLLSAAWTPADRTQHAIRLPITEAMRGGVTLRTTFVRDNRAVCRQQTVQVPWTNQQLNVRWERQVSKLGPAQEETWTAVVSGSKATAVAAEMVATLYDASLDQFAPHHWTAGFWGFRQENGWRQVHALGDAARFQGLWQRWDLATRNEPQRYRSLLDMLRHHWRWGFRKRGRVDRDHMPMPKAAPRAEMAFAASDMDAENMQSREGGGALAQAKAPGEAPANPPANDVAAVVPRRNLAETAFFLPHAQTEADGTIRLRFTMPESLTTWRFLGFVHDRDLRAGLLTGEAVTSKELMVEPNPPRFVREGDVIAFTAKVSNQGEAELRGWVRLAIADAVDGASRDAAVGNATPEQEFMVPAKQARTFSWTLRIPDGAGPLTYAVTGASDRLGDGETSHLPVLSRRILVTESLPLPLRGAGKKEFRFDKLLKNDSPTLRHQLLSVQMVSRPAWYAMLALPFLMEPLHESSDAVFYRYYANALARHIATGNPRIRAVFDAWRNTPVLDSPLTKNQDLKQLLIEDTPWLAAARSEGEQRRNVGRLFDANHVDDELRRALAKLAQYQQGDGTWPWFPGGRGDIHITLRILAGFGRLHHLGVKDLDLACAHRAIAALDQWISEQHAAALRAVGPDSHTPTPDEALYLYGRSFFHAARPIPKEHQAAVAFFRARAAARWANVGSRMTQAHLALALHRFDDKAPAQAILASLRERAMNDEEQGLHWRDGERDGWWWWHRAPVETQALMIEAFDEVAGDRQAVTDAQVWLLKQKQVQGWRSSAATADAVYALLKRGDDLLAGTALVQVDLGGRRVTPEQVEAGTGFFEQRFTGAAVRPEQGAITLTKTDDGVAWGSVHWQYLEDIARVAPADATPLRLAKSLGRAETTKNGQRLVPITGALAVGDELVCRVELRTDRDLEYVHLKDQRGAGTEPVDVLSQWRWQDGLGYFQSTRGTASHFFISWLPRGTHVFEYRVRVQLRGTYQSGIATLQCLYAPEFNAHSASTELRVE